MQDEIDSLTVAVDDLKTLTRFLKGHPIWPLDDPADIVLFDFTTGKGSGIWTGWAICNGSSYPGTSGPIATPDLRDRFIVGSQGSYNVGDTGGANTVTLVVNEIPAHNHAVTDPGHTHVITDPGHTHQVLDPGHTHAASAAPHIHTFTTDNAGAHTHTYQLFSLAGDAYKMPTSIPPDQADFSYEVLNTSSNGDHVHTGVVDPTTVAVAIANSFTGIQMDDAFTGITNVINATGISIVNTGGGSAHENRPPYFALLFVKKIY